MGIDPKNHHIRPTTAKSFFSNNQERNSAEDNNSPVLDSMSGPHPESFAVSGLPDLNL